MQGCAATKRAFLFLNLLPWESCNASQLQGQFSLLQIKSSTLVSKVEDPHKKEKWEFFFFVGPELSHIFFFHLLSCKNIFSIVLQLSPYLSEKKTTGSNWPAQQHTHSQSPMQTHGGAHTHMTGAHAQPPPAAAAASTTFLMQINRPCPADRPDPVAAAWQPVIGSWTLAPGCLTCCPSQPLSTVA